MENAITKETWQLVKTEAKKFGAIHWAFILCVVLPLSAIAAPFYAMGMIGNLIGALITWLALKLPDYNVKP
jgi:hypothetical protein